MAAIQQLVNSALSNPQLQAQLNGVLSSIPNQYTPQPQYQQFFAPPVVMQSPVNDQVQAAMEAAKAVSEARVAPGLFEVPMWKLALAAAILLALGAGGHWAIGKLRG